MRPLASHPKAPRAARRIGVKRRLLLRILAYSALVTVAMSSLTLFFDYRADIARIEQHLEQIRVSYAQSLAQSLWHLNSDEPGSDLGAEAVKLQLDGILRFPGVHSVELREPSTPAPAAHELPYDILQREIELHYERDGRRVELGSLVVTVTLSDVYGRLWRKLAIVLASQAAEAFVIAACIFLIVQSIVTRDLGRIAHHVRTMDLQTLGKPLGLERRCAADDEITDVVAAINAMSSSLQAKLADLNASHRALDELNRDLEHKVQARTAELSEALAVLQTSERRFRDVTENCGDWIWELDEQGRFQYSSTVVARVLGHRPEELAGRGFCETFCGDDAERHTQEFRDAIARGKPLLGFVNVSRAKDGRPVILETSMVPVRLSESAVCGYRGVSRDITARKEAEAKLLAAHRQLLQTSRRAGRAEVATSVLHNMGNVLNGVTVSVSLLREKLSGSSLRDLQRVMSATGRTGELERIFSEGPRSTGFRTFLEQLSVRLSAEHESLSAELRALNDRVDLIRNLLHAHEHFGRVGSSLETTSGPELMEEMLRLNEGALDPHGIRLERDYGSERIAIRADKHKIIQILSHLFLNAKDALCAAEGAQKVITLRVRADADALILAVADNGVGIEPENLDRIFAYGFTTKDNGHGFGLHDSANTAQELGGALSASSQGRGTGAEFRLTLPLRASG